MISSAVSYCGGKVAVTCKVMELCDPIVRALRHEGPLTVRC
jgi:hypothetical protein